MSNKDKILKQLESARYSVNLNGESVYTGTAEQIAAQIFDNKMPFVPYYKQEFNFIEGAKRDLVNRLGKLTNTSLYNPIIEACTLDINLIR